MLMTFCVKLFNFTNKVSLGVDPCCTSIFSKCGFISYKTRREWSMTEGEVLAQKILYKNCFAVQWIFSLCVWWNILVKSFPKTYFEKVAQQIRIPESKTCIDLMKMVGEILPIFYRSLWIIFEYNEPESQKCDAQIGLNGIRYNAWLIISWLTCSISSIQFERERCSSDTTMVDKMFVLYPI